MKEINITIQEFRTPHGKGWLFIDKADNTFIAEVDKRKDKKKYDIFYRHVQVGQRTSRLAAMNFAIDTISERNPNTVINYKQSVVVIKEHF